MTTTAPQSVPTPPGDNPYSAPRTDSPAPLPAGLEDRFRTHSPTFVRFGVLFALCTLALLLYIDRVCIGQAATWIKSDLKLTDAHLSWILNAFMFAYCVFEVPTGHWGDRYGSRRVIARIVVWWSAFTALTGAAFGFWPLMGIRFLFGVGEAGAFPNAARIVTRWFPIGERGLARGSITTASQLGGAIAPPLAAAIIGLVGWRWTFVVFGAVGCVWAALFYWWFRDEPAEHPAVGAPELKHIGKPPAGDDDHPPIRWGRVVASPNVWLMGAIMMVGATLYYMLFQWYPTYLKEARGLSEQVSGWFTGIAMSGGAVGCITGGLLSDLISRSTSERRWSRRLCGAGMVFLAALSLAGVRYADNALAASVLCAFALFFLQVSIPTWWGVVAEISGKHGAAMFGVMNGMGGLGVMTLNILVGWSVTGQKAAIPAGTSEILTRAALIQIWRPIFDGVAIALAVGAVLWLFVDATRPIFAAEDEPR